MSNPSPRKAMDMSAPQSVSGREVIIGGGVHAAIYVATRAMMGYPKPIVLESTGSTGGIFSQLVGFKMNSANYASRESTGRGPTRIASIGPTDDLNYLPNSPFQVRDEAGAIEYPNSRDMAMAVRRTLDRFSDVYTDARVTTEDEAGSVRFDLDGDVYTTGDSYDSGQYLGNARRIIWAAGLSMPDKWSTAKAVQTAQAFLHSPTRSGMDTMRVAVVGSGDSAATVVEYLLGQGFSAPYELPRRISWYGGSSLPATREAWYDRYHARYSGIGRHLPQVLQAAIEGSYDSDDDQDEVISPEGIIRPFNRRGEITPAGNLAIVNGEMYDLVVDATGFRRNRSEYGFGSTYRVGDIAVANFDSDYDKVYTIGASSGIEPGTDPYPNSYPASQAAIYQLAPLTAAFAANLPR